MQLSIGPDDLRPIVASVLSEALLQLDADRAIVDAKLAYSEAEAARLLSLKVHQLRDERLRGRIASSSIVGRQIRYSQADLMAYLNRNRTEATV